MKYVIVWSDDNMKDKLVEMQQLIKKLWENNEKFK